MVYARVIFIDPEVGFYQDAELHSMKQRTLLHLALSTAAHLHLDSRKNLRCTIVALPVEVAPHHTQLCIIIVAGSCILYNTIAVDTLLAVLFVTIVLQCCDD